MNSFALAAILHTSAKQTELCLSAHKNALTDKGSGIYKHLRDCDQIQHIQGLYNLPDIFINEKNPPTAMNKEFLTQTVHGSTNIIAMIIGIYYSIEKLTISSVQHHT